MENTKSKKRTNKIYVYDNTTKGKKHKEKLKKIPIDISTIKWRIKTKICERFMIKQGSMKSMQF